MIDAAILPLQRRLMQPPARALARRGVRADQITLVGLAIGLAAAGVAALGLFALALAGLILNRLADGLDGAVARLTQPTDRGAYLDIALDFVFYAAFPLGFALHDPAANALPAAILLASFILSGTSFLAFSIIADRRGLTSRDYPTKGIYYLGGLTEGAEDDRLLRRLLPVSKRLSSASLDLRRRRGDHGRNEISGRVAAFRKLPMTFSIHIGPEYPHVPLFRGHGSRRRTGLLGLQSHGDPRQFRRSRRRIRPPRERRRDVGRGRAAAGADRRAGRHGAGAASDAAKPRWDEGPARVATCRCATMTAGSSTTPCFFSVRNLCLAFHRRQRRRALGRRDWARAPP
jgi:hypothetical protein